MKYTLGVLSFVCAVLIGNSGVQAREITDYRDWHAYVYARVLDVEPVYASLPYSQSAEGIWLAGSPDGEAFNQLAGQEPLEYKVTYLFRGEKFQTRLDYIPGEWIKVKYRVKYEL